MHGAGSNDRQQSDMKGVGLIGLQCRSLCMAFLLAGTAQAQLPDTVIAEWELHGRAEGLARPDTVCQDFLQAMGKKPAELEYVGCTQDDASYLQPMEARYRVSGASAARIEAYLQQTFGMPSLTYVCCGWSNGAPYFWRQQPGSVNYQIGMGVESLHHPRGQWSAIPYFAVTVAVNRKSP